MGNKLLGSPVSQVHSRQKERSGRQIKLSVKSWEQSGPCTKKWWKAVSPLGNADGGSVRHLFQQKTGSILLSSSGPMGGGGRRPSISVGQPGCLHLSTLLYDSSGDQQGDDLQEPQDDFGNSLVASR